MQLLTSIDSLQRISSVIASMNMLCCKFWNYELSKGGLIWPMYTHFPNLQTKNSNLRQIFNFFSKFINIRTEGKSQQYQQFNIAMLILHQWSDGTSYF